jgi:glycosyltransferase involved in cell wall biosynthesis
MRCKARLSGGYLADSCDLDASGNSMILKISIGIPFKDPGAYFELALKSVFAQTLADWELILIDDGSRDDSVAVAKSLRDSRVRVYADGKHKYLSARLNELVQLSNAPYFARMDADDIMHPERLERQYRLITQYTGDVVVGSAAYSTDSSSRPIGFRPSRQRQEVGFDARHSFIHPTVMAPTFWFRQHPYDPVHYRCEDAELWCRTASTTKFVNLPEPLLYYREVKRFSIANYFETSFGLLFLLFQKFSKPRGKFMYLFTRELCKAWIGVMSDSLGSTDWLVARRYRPLNSAELQRANAALEFVKQQTLPVM